MRLCQPEKCNMKTNTSCTIINVTFQEASSHLQTKKRSEDRKINKLVKTRLMTQVQKMTNQHKT